MFVEKDEGEKILFIGDSFTPSGIDDYCLLNRNFLHEGMGYFYCLNFLREIPPGCLLINQHVLEPFRYDPKQITHMTEVLRKRKKLLAELFPWDECNYGIDEQWAGIFPYGRKAKAGDTLQVAVKILNHSDSDRLYNVRLNVPVDFQVRPTTDSQKIGPLKEGQCRFELVVPDNPSEKVYVITADIKFGRWDLRQWCEGMIEIKP